MLSKKFFAVHAALSPLVPCLASGIVAGAMAASPAYAQTPSAAQPGAAMPDSAESVFTGKRSREIFEAQVLLDRASFSPGEIDGYAGGNTSRAVRTWQRAQGLTETGRVDADVLAKLRSTGGAAPLRDYTVSEADVAGPFGPLPEGMEALSEIEAPHYETLAEALGEKFHMSPDLLRALNPGIDQVKAGDSIRVAAVDPTPLGGKVARIEIDSASATLNAFASDGKLVASYPATVGSSEFPSPNGSMEVRTLAPAPAYYFSPEGRDWGPDKKLTIAAGPNNPVGSTWIDLTKEGYGIHGSPDPKLIGKTASHGCVRLTNWDAKELGAAVEKGTTVTFL